MVKPLTEWDNIQPGMPNLSPLISAGAVVTSSGSIVVRFEYLEAPEDLQMYGRVKRVHRIFS